MGGLIRTHQNKVGTLRKVEIKFLVNGCLPENCITVGVVKVWNLKWNKFEIDPTVSTV